MEVKWINIEEVKPYEKNPRKNDKAVEIVSDSIMEFGFKNPILIDENNVILAGHTRLKAAQRLGLDKIPTLQFTDLKEAQKKAFRIMDNKSGEYADWDMDLLKDELTDLKNLDFDLDLTGFSENEIDKLIPTEIKEDFGMPPKPKYDIKTGDIYQLGTHRLMCGDCTIKDSVNKLVNSHKINIALTDPPYGIDIVKYNKVGFGLGRLESESTKRMGTIGGGGIAPAGIHQKIIGDDKPFDPQFLLDYGENQIIWGGNYFASKLKDSSCWIIWDKREDIPSNNFADCEIAWTSFDKPSRIYRQLWSGLLRKGDRENEMSKRIHPTQKPVGIHIKLLQDYTQENDNILDLFGGSGTTIIACEITKRNCYCMEIDPVYCSHIIERWEKLTDKKAVKL